jgi:hypothetical protein
VLPGGTQVLHMMLGLERMDRMRMFADELTAVAPPRSTRTLGSAAVGSDSRRHTAGGADEDPASQRSVFPQPSGRRVRKPVPQTPKLQTTQCQPILMQSMLVKHCQSVQL